MIESEENAANLEAENEVTQELVEEEGVKNFIEDEGVDQIVAEYKAMKLEEPESNYIDNQVQSQFSLLTDSLISEL